ncbi:MAG: glycosyltransferase, partial [Actinomycetes bacterium]
MPYGPTDPSDARHVVTAVLVTHDGSRWLPEMLSALASQDRPVQRLVVADTGSRDATSEILAERVGEEHVVEISRGLGFGTAVSRAVATVPAVSPDGSDVVEWLWLLHDDCAPAPDALAHLLAVGETSPSAAVLGPKVRGWYDKDQLLEVGITVTRSGRRETGLERGETDQGQHDGIREVLAVSTAGMLVRRDLFERLGGFDPALPIFRDDLDLGWRVNLAGHRVLVVPDAVVHHAEAASLSRRRVDCARNHRHLADRRNALHVLLANLPLSALPLAYPRFVVVSVLRSIGYVLSKRVGFAVDELAALLLVLLRPDKVMAARRRRRRSGPLDHRAARHLLAPRGAQLRHMADVVTGLLTGRRDALDQPAFRHAAHESHETGPATDDVENLEAAGGEGLRRLLGRPSLLLVAGLTLVTLAAARDLLWGGTLMGGALLPAPPGVSDLWQTYVASWHDVGIGSDATAPPYLAVVATVGTVLLGKAGAAVDLLMLGAVPLAALSAYRASAGLVESRLLRVWAAAAYALLPAATGAVAAGRLGTAVGIVLLPVLARLFLRTLALLPRPPASNTPWATGAVLAVVAAFVPSAYLLAVVLGLLALGLLGARDRAMRLGIVVAVPPIVLLPWTLDVLRDPSLLLLEAGAPGPDLSDPVLDPIALVLLHPGGPGMYPVVLSAGLLVAALAALLRPTRRLPLVVSWAVAVVAIVFSLLMSRFDLTGPTSGAAVAAWPGFPTAVAGLAVVVAVTIGAEGALEGLTNRAFSWRQPAAVGLAVVAGLSPVLA